MINTERDFDIDITSAWNHAFETETSDTSRIFPIGIKMNQKVNIDE